MRGEDVLGLVDHAQNIQPVLLKAIDDLVGSVQAVAEEVDKERSASAKKIALLQVQIGDLEARLASAERNKERFRFALYVYLQERDGILGVHAPSLNTLNRIRELLEEPLDS